MVGFSLAMLRATLKHSGLRQQRFLICHDAMSCQGSANSGLLKQLHSTECCLGPGLSWAQRLLVRLPHLMVFHLRLLHGMSSRFQESEIEPARTPKT